MADMKTDIDALYDELLEACKVCATANTLAQFHQGKQLAEAAVRSVLAADKHKQDDHPMIREDCGFGGEWK